MKINLNVKEMKKERLIRFTFRVCKNNKVMQKYDSSSIRRFKNHIGTINWQNLNFKVYLKANYSHGYFNDGFYYAPGELLFALEAFTDISIREYLHG